jgi:hypothetical protein
VLFDPSGASGALEDKELMAVDANVSSPFRDRIYVTWTEFAADGSAYIYATHSNDYGEHFSAPVVVSGNNPALCDQTYGVPTTHGNCNENQDSDPFIGPDGALYVAFNNYNTLVAGNENKNRVLLAKSTDAARRSAPPCWSATTTTCPTATRTRAPAPIRAGPACRRRARRRFRSSAPRTTRRAR